MCFQTDAAKGKVGTKKFVAPVLKKLFGGEVVQTENRLNRFEQSLDCNHSIDGFVCSPRGLLPFAARYQSVNYGSFPIRFSRPTGAETEYSKIVRALETNSAMRPFYHAQGYSDEDGGAVVAVVRTEDLFSFIKQHRNKTKIIPQADKTEVLAVFWRDLKQAGVNFKKFLVSEDGDVKQI